MLDTLRRIIQEVNAAPDLERALEIIVQRVRESVDVDVASVYLMDIDKQQYELRATEGLRKKAIGNVYFNLDEGLVGMVGQREELVNLEDAPSHPRYRFTIETGEEPYHGFLGVPIIQHGKVLGVLVVRQRQTRKFAEEEEAFLVTLAAQLAGAITHAGASGRISAVVSPVHAETLEGAVATTLAQHPQVEGAMAGVRGAAQQRSHGREVGHIARFDRGKPVQSGVAQFAQVAEPARGFIKIAIGLESPAVLEKLEPNRRGRRGNYAVRRIQ